MNRSCRVAALVFASVIAVHGFAAQTPVPTISGTSPTSAAAGSGNLQLTVNGSNFLAGSYVVFSGAPVATTYIGPNQLIAAVPSSLLTSPGLVTVIVLNSGTVQSNAVGFLVTSSLSITTASVPAATTGLPYSFTLSASGGTPPYSWSGDSLPAGLTLASTGLISGTPTATGTFSFNARVSDAAQSSTSKAFSITIAPPALSITTSSPLLNAVAGQTYSQALTATGGAPPYQWSAQSLPPGLSIDPKTGVISGTPSAAGTFNFTIQVADAAQLTATRMFALTVSAPPVIITTVSPLFTGVVGTAYSQTFSASGGVPPYTWAILSGGIGGLTLDSGSGTLHGTPQSPGVFTFTLQVSDSVGSKASQAFSVTVNSPTLTITTDSSLPAGAVGTAYSQTFGVVGGTAPYTWSLSTGSVPGLTFNPGQAALTGTPSAAGTYSFTLQAQDANGIVQSKTFTIKISGPPLNFVTTDAQVPAATLGAAYTFALTAAGGMPPYTWSANGLPTGLSIDSQTGVISGTPAAAGPFPFTVRVADSTLANIVSLFHLTVGLPAAPSASISGLSATVNPAQQVPLKVALSSAFPADITGQAFLTFAPDSGAGDATIQFASGGRTAAFTVPAGSTDAVSAVPLAIQTGTVAGTITITLRILAGGIDVTPTPAPTATARVDPTAPVITSATLTRTNNGFSIQIVGYSTTLDVTQATFTFAAAPGQTLQSTTITVPAADMFTAWFQSSAAAQFGSQFKFTQPFTIQGEVSSVTPQSVTLTNRVGSSAPATISQ